MRNHISYRYAVIIFSCIFLFSCKRDDLFTEVQKRVDDKASLSTTIDPAQTGPWSVKGEKYNINDMVEYNSGIVYYPYQNTETGPLVLFLHGNNTGGCDNYSQILKHLASQGFYIASISWPSGDYKAPDKIESIKNSVLKHIRYLYYDNSSPLKGKITDNIVLMGHSRGGGFGTSFAADIDKVKHVQSVIALAPSPATLDMPEKFSLTCAASFLVIYGSADVDVAGQWDKTVNARKSGFKFFDDAGYEWGNAAFTKDMIFIKGLNHGTFCDVDQDILSGSGGVNTPRQHIIKGYINAFLQWHINKNEAYNKFFKYQAIIPSMDPSIKISQQHVDGEKLVLANFENQNADKLTHYGGDITYPLSSLAIKVDKAAILDPYSFHATNAMAIYWEQNSNKPDPSIDFAFKDKIDLSAYKYLSIRAGICTYYLNVLNREQSFYIQLVNDNGSKSSLVPLTIPSSFFAFGSKSYMQSFLLPLYQFKGVDLSKIKSVSLLFTNKNYTKGKIMLDNMEFYK